LLEGIKVAHLQHGSAVAIHASRSSPTFFFFFLRRNFVIWSPPDQTLFFIYDDARRTSTRNEREKKSHSTLKTYIHLICLSVVGWELPTDM
jgi:hypothetical protein